MDLIISSLEPREQALLAGLSESDARRFATYLFSRPKKADGIPKLRSQAIGLYDPFCDRRKYPMGILWQSAPYSYCSHGCAYCYARSYLCGFSDGARVKTGFARAFDRCLATMDALKLPPRHLSMANSTDLLQPDLEREHRLALFMLKRVAANKDQFSSVGLLTKAPTVLLDELGYVEALLRAGVEVQVSIPFFRDEKSVLVEPRAPTASERMSAVEELVNSGVRVAVRIDPLFPRDVPDCTEYQSREEDLVPLVEWASRAGVSYIISSPLKLVYRRNVESKFTQSVQAAFPITRGNYRRMEDWRQKALIDEMRELCKQHGLEFEHCFGNILKRVDRATKKDLS